MNHIEEEASNIVNKDRQSQYGHPFSDFSRTAKIWEAILGIPITPNQVALCMLGVKLSREVHKPKYDNRLDMIGYVNCLELVVKEQEKNGTSN